MQKTMNMEQLHDFNWYPRVPYAFASTVSVYYVSAATTNKTSSRVHLTVSFIEAFILSLNHNLHVFQAKSSVNMGCQS